MLQQQENKPKWTYHQQVSFCGKARCAKCQQKIGHGPYWYAYGIDDGTGRTIKRYLGKSLPPEIQQELELQQELEKQRHLPTETMPPTAQIRIYTLGQFRLERWSPEIGWRPVTRAAWQQHRVRSLLGCVLASPRRTLAREQLMEQLWPGIAPEKASARLDRAVYDLRGLLEERTTTRLGEGSLLSAEEGVIALAPQEQLWVDADEFEALLHRAWQRDEEQEVFLKQARQLYAGSFLPREEQYQILLSCRERLHRGWIALLMAQADAQSSRQDLPEAIEALYMLIKADPLNEGAVQRLMKLLWQTGQRDKGVILYKRVSSLLRQQYNIAPLPETRAIYEAMRRGFSLSALPPPTTPTATARPLFFGRPHRHALVGREIEREQIRALLALTEMQGRFKVAGQKKQEWQT